jgi:hypothetical protein
MAKLHQQDQQNLTFDEMMRFLDSEFQRFPEHRAGNAVRYELADVLKSAFAMFALKSPSLLDFKKQTIAEESNLRSIFRIEGAIPCDNQMRGALDPLDPSCHCGNAACIWFLPMPHCRNDTLDSIDDAIWSAMRMRAETIENMAGELIERYNRQMIVAAWQQAGSRFALLAAACCSKKCGYLLHLRVRANSNYKHPDADKGVRYAV